MPEILNKTQLDRFSKCYIIYQRKGGIGAAQKAFKKLDPDDKLTDEIQRAIIAQNIDRKKNPVDKNFLPEFGPWLNAKRWLDPIETSKSETGSQLGNCKCGKPVDYAHSGNCLICEGNAIRETKRREIADILTGMGIYVPGDTREELNAKCRKYLTENMSKTIKSKRTD